MSIRNCNYYVRKKLKTDQVFWNLQPAILSLRFHKFSLVFLVSPHLFMLRVTVQGPHHQTCYGSCSIAKETATQSLKGNELSQN